ncbi:gamma-glutamylcyclotransferase [soil metagenome]
MSSESAVLSRQTTSDFSDEAATCAPAIDCTGTCVEHLPLWTEQQLEAHLDESLEHWDGESDLWVFAYGSLIWKPEIDSAETRHARIYGYHRSLCLWSTVNRGTPAKPGLVLALDTGGSCEGLAFRVEATRVRSEFRRLWRREMMRGSYLPTWLGAHTPQGRVSALAFVMDRALPTYAGRLSDDAIVENLRHSSGLCGSSAQYLLSTVDALKSHGLADRRLTRYRHLYERSAP